MDLPIITLPVQIPEFIPVLLHPVAVHFVVVLPLVILILELINLITKRKSLTITVYILFVMLLAVLMAAYATGVTDGKEAGPLLGDDGLAALKSHKLIGVYLIYLTLLPLLLKAMTLFVKQPWAKVVYLLSFVGVITLTVFQAKEGGELVYQYGANVQSQQVLEDKLEEFEDAMDELKSSYEEQIAALTPKTDENSTVNSDNNTTVLNSEEVEKIAVKVKSAENNTTAVKADVNKSVTVKSSESNGTK